MHPATSRLLGPSTCGHGGDATALASTNHGLPYSPTIVVILVITSRVFSASTSTVSRPMTGGCVSTLFVDAAPSSGSSYKAVSLMSCHGTVSRLGGSTYNSEHHDSRISAVLSCRAVITSRMPKISLGKGETGRSAIALATGRRAVGVCPFPIGGSWDTKNLGPISDKRPLVLRSGLCRCVTSTTVT